jgi:two-component system response regulator AtoC
MPGSKHIRALLAVKDEQARSALGASLRARGDSAELSAADLSASVRSIHPDIVFLESDDTAAQLKSLRRLFPAIPVAVLGAPSSELAFSAAKLGATAWLNLPLDEQRLPALVDDILASVNGPDAIARPAGEHTELSNLLSQSPRMREINETIDKVADTTATVLLRGESGVGKDVVARLIYSRSARNRRPFVKVNCAAIPNELLESELFGYEAGAFTGAQRAKPGKFELADGGTLFLDEIGEMHPALQAKLLHVLQDGQFARLGAKRDTAVDVRVICATNKQLEQRVVEGLFREDLFYRINVITIHIPPLRERAGEIPDLIDHFVRKFSSLYSREARPFSDENMESLIHYAWPGNIRELENVCKRYVIVGDARSIIREISSRLLDISASASIAEPQLDASLMPGRQAAEAGESSDRNVPSLLEIGRDASWQAERKAIEQMLLETRWNRREAARRLKVSYKSLLNKIKRIEVMGQ